MPVESCLHLLDKLVLTERFSGMRALPYLSSLSNVLSLGDLVAPTCRAACLCPEFPVQERLLFRPRTNSMSLPAGPLIGFAFIHQACPYWICFDVTQGAPKMAWA